ncbi:MAG: rsxD [Bacteroidetes bacterium]|jgi:Na+-translocating ferredoxin:NAD+ oxidoreductase subunit D|nr:rsxD [Bacteroidota bacterium]
MRKIMQDVLLALLPIAAISYFAYGATTLLLILVAVATAVASEFIFSLIYKGEASSIRDGSSVITAVLLTFTLAPFTPWYVVAFGASTAVIFGKFLWGGMGKNRLNPALLGREFMTIFFPAVMSSRTIWYDKDLLQFKDLHLFDFLGNNPVGNILNYLFFNPSGAIGEYSILFLVLGGLFLLVRKRITWHIPFGIAVTFFLLFLLFQDHNIRFSLGGVLLGAIFMATDMPTCAKTKPGKLFYGAMIASTAILFLLNDVRYEYMSYSILLMNLFAKTIDTILKPQEWNSSTWIKQTGKALLLTIAILLSAYLVALIHQHIGVRYLLFVFMGYIIYDFIRRLGAKKVAAR